MKNLEECKKQAKTKEERCEVLKERWLPELKRQVEKVSENMSDYFGRIKCEGRVSLGIPEDPTQYSRYQLFIRVRFREGMPLQVRKLS